MGVLRWSLRCIPGLSVFGLLILLESALKIVETEWLSFFYPPFLKHIASPVVAQTIFISYSLFLHILALLFPLRLCASAYSAAREIKAAHRPSKLTPSDTLQCDVFRDDPRELHPQQDTAKRLGTVTMAVVLPSYKEDIEILETSLRVLASHTLAKSSYDIFLAMEERDPNGVNVAQNLIQLFAGKFREMQYTVHPAGLPGEAPGKSSNVSWAARQIERKYLNDLDWSSVLVTVMDSDTHLLSQYFETILVHHLRSRRDQGLTDMTLYMPPIIFDRNAHLVPQMVRIADLMWCGAGLSCFTSKPTGSTIAIPTAVYTLPLPLVCLAGGWDTGSEAIGEDMHMMLKCYFAANGRMKIRSIPSPASQCNVTTGKAGVRGWLANHSARYAQGLRHMWGCLDTGYAVRQWCKIGAEPNPHDQSTPSSETSSSDSGRPNRPRHVEICLKLSQHALHGPSLRRFTWRNLILFSRLFEAHFLPIHLFLVLLASAIYTALPYPITSCRLLTAAMDLTSVLRGISFALMTIYFVIFYERYHGACIEAREREMRRAGLYEELADEFSYRRRFSLITMADYVLFPIAGTVFGSVPLLQAIVSHFWTEKLVYLVSAKPVKTITKNLISVTVTERGAEVIDV
ncbi:uncharacterized protein Z519_01983 [Cladophialophora bantiana CBS 173.52]|uniref:Glycosyltransferase 2-like domain-containing protein n=1 Tax=Cladophialophora bantiana (strain ATCC 10958 / CBS 173.52 / CDC B-1940 / NIH 8579) TaxID=1442370 RepID=A0A0D2GE05_CLAB1|nr:uncharacterized protein Z519_01983 [Cladophialophora bantiana CBS 173.52]KIW96592.1 hypothetical protein Z519_01983 [Cladophialophora bantiana CBS 173.52]